IRESSSQKDLIFLHPRLRQIFLAIPENSRPSSELGGLYDSLLTILLIGKMHIVKTNLKVI
ncbi:TPA: hypothetical protein ACWTWG_003305, partial [Escherichia coli]